MMACTDRHYRYFARLMSERTLLYTEMVTQDAIIHGDREHLLGYNPQEHPLALQLGGSDPQKLAQCARIATDYGYDEINLNVGCPSDRVQSGQIGACLMAKPQLVAQCVAAMKAVTHLPVTVKTRLGIDKLDSYDFLVDFTQAQIDVGVDALIVHARKAWLKGLSPRENREVPPLDYARVYQLKADFPDLEIIINGGIKNLTEAKAHLQFVDGVMLGRAAYYDSYILANVDREIFTQDTECKSREQVVQLFTPYFEAQKAQGVKHSSISRHILGLYFAQPGARQWRVICTTGEPLTSYQALDL